MNVRWLCNLSINNCQSTPLYKVAFFTSSNVSFWTYFRGRGFDGPISVHWGGTRHLLAVNVLGIVVSKLWPHHKIIDSDLLDMLVHQWPQKSRIGYNYCPEDYCKQRITSTTKFPSARSSNMLIGAVFPHVKTLHGLMMYFDSFRWKSFTEVHMDSFFGLTHLSIISTLHSSSHGLTLSPIAMSSCRIMHYPNPTCSCPTNCLSKHTWILHNVNYRCRT